MIDPRALTLIDRYRIDDDQVSIDGELWPPREADVLARDERPLLSRLADAIYQEAYARLPVEPLPVLPDATGQASDDDFVDSVIEAHHTEERWDAGWTLDAVSTTGHVSIVRDADWRYAAPGDYRIDPAGRGLRPGARVALLVRPFDLESQPGSIYLHGERQDDRASFGWLGRFYFNVDAADMPDWVRCVSTLLNRYGVAFTMKCPARRRLCVRLDSLVLYVPVRHCSFTARLVDRARTVQADLFARLGDETPLFSKPLARGIGFAEDPGSGDSFGSDRARLLARALIDHGQSADGTLDWQTRLAGVFAAEGLNLETPWLCPGSIDRFDFPESAGARNPATTPDAAMTSERTLPAVRIDPALFAASSRSRS